MKKILSLLLCFVMLTGALVSCGKKDENAVADKGAIIPIYLASEIKNFDPALAYTDDSAVKVLGLLYEGLTKINSDGKMEKALAKNWKIIEDEKDKTYKMQIELNATKWSDGRTVAADDVVYAWKRILEPEFTSSASAMLFDIKNARKVKEGEMTIDDLGIASIDEKVLEIEFETKIDYDLFLENLASPALVPLREDIVTKGPDWAEKSSTMATNGAFIIKSFEIGKELVLERSIYYYLKGEKDENLQKFVTPYRFVINYSDDPATQEAAFNAGTIFFDGELPLASRANHLKSAEIQDIPSTHTYYFNESVKPFSDANVRKALSIAIDRTQVASIVGFAKPATGFISYNVFDKDAKTSFRKVGGDIIAPSANVSEAQNLLSTAGVSSGSFTITHRRDDVDKAIAEYVAGVWNGLGFKVELKELGTNQFNEAFREGDYDVIAFDHQMLSTDAFSSLAPFSPKFSGNAMDLASGEYDPVPHITGFNDETYNAKVEAIYAEKNRATRATLLHELETLFVQLSPAMPVVFNQDAYVISSELSGVKTDFYGKKIFNKAKLKNYQDYLPQTEDAGEKTTETEK